jgi:hypothetical protein
MNIDLTAAARRADPEEARAWLADQRVFMSSAMADTADERRAVADGVEGEGARAVLFEELGRDAGAGEAYLTGVDSSTIYVGILNEIYGTMLETGFSPTETEYMRARERGKRVAVFIAADAPGREGSIGWIERLEPHGDPLPPEVRARVVEMSNRMLPVGSPLLARAIRPDPGEPGAMAVVAGSRTGRMDAPDAALCIFSIAGTGIGGGCSPFGILFEREPLTIGLGGSGASQYSTLSGLASDDVHELKVFLSSGDTIDVPLRDNVYRTRVARSDFPIERAGSMDRVITVLPSPLVTRNSTGLPPP